MVVVAALSTLLLLVISFPFCHLVAGILLDQICMCHKLLRVIYATWNSSPLEATTLAMVSGNYTIFCKPVNGNTTEIAQKLRSPYIWRCTL